MTFARLAPPHAGGKRSETHAAVNVAFTSRAPHGAVYARRELIEDGSLTSRHEKVFERRLSSTLINTTQLTRDNAFLAEHEKQSLDEQGLIKQGMRVRGGDVLWSAVCRPLAIPGRKAKQSQRETDQSRRVPKAWEGAIVADVQLQESKQGQVVAVTLALEAPLTAGDALYMEDEFLGVLAGVWDEEQAAAVNADADLFASGEVGRRLKVVESMLYGAAVAKGERVAPLHALPRRTGPFSLITRQPLQREDEGAPAQPISPRHARWLFERGLTHLLAEFASLKCDDVASRPALAAFAAGDLSRGQLPKPQAPVSLWKLQAELMAMGLHVQIDGDAAPAVRVRPATPEELRSVSCGEVRKPDTLNFRTLEGEPAGLFCPTLFQDKLTRFGHIELAAPIVPYWWRCGSPSALEGVLPLTAQQVQDLASHRRFVRVEQDAWEWSAVDAVPAEPDQWLTGGQAIRRLLEVAAPRELPPGLPYGAETLAPDVLLVLPAPLRPLVMLDDGNFATSDLNDLYRRVINRNNRIRKLAELQAPQVILQNERRMLQQAVDALFANRWLPRPAQVRGQNKRPLASLADVAFSWSSPPLSKRVHWSAQSRAVADAPATSAMIPRNIYEELRLSADAPVLLTMPDGAAFVALTPTPGEAPVVRLPREAAQTLGLPYGEDEFISLHAPLGEAAVEEARNIQRGDLQARKAAFPRTWLNLGPDAKAKDILLRLIEAALHAEPVPLHTPETALLTGMGAWEFREA